MSAETHIYYSDRQNGDSADQLDLGISVPTRPGRPATWAALIEELEALYVQMDGIGEGIGQALDRIETATEFIGARVDATRRRDRRRNRRGTRRALR